MDALYLSNKKDKARSRLEEMYAMDPHLEAHEIKTFHREQSILMAA